MLVKSRTRQYQSTWT
uniref:Uncharacterized protein n=1 Tax=Arundo donax TaxID=35708 RepID=A0A0A9FPF3_ARUDO